MFMPMQLIYDFDTVSLVKAQLDFWSKTSIIYIN
jgi:hypothetical protein